MLDVARRANDVVAAVADMLSSRPVANNRLLAPGGSFVAKVLEGGMQSELLAQMKHRFVKVRHVKPPASRKDSAEMYVVATGFRRADGA